MAILRVKDEHGQVTDIPAIRGEKGDKGDKGEKGEQGTPGADGNDGVSPDVSVSKTGRIATITITDADGAHTFSLIDGKDGTDGKNFAILGYFSSLEALQAAIETPTAGMAYGIGASAPYDIYVYDAVSETWKNNGSLSGVKGDDGFSPTIEIETVSNGHRVTVTDKNGSQSFNVTNGTNGTNGTDGQDGAKGEDGFSPTITVTEITNGHRVSISAKDGSTSSFDVMNGEKGDQGNPGSDATVTVDSEMSSTSENPVQNKVVSAAISSAISSQPSETWTFTLKSGETVTKTVVLK